MCHPPQVGWFTRVVPLSPLLHALTVVTSQVLPRALQRPPSPAPFFPSLCEDKWSFASNELLWLFRAARCPGTLTVALDVSAGLGISARHGPLSGWLREPQPAYGRCLRESRRHGVFIRMARSSLCQLWNHGSWLSLEQAWSTRTLCSFSFWQNTRLELFFSSSFSQTSPELRLPPDLSSSNTNSSVIRGETPPII